MNNTKIDWCDSTWNPVTGCLHGCEYCYARKIAKRFGGWYYSPGMCRINIADDSTYIAPQKAYYGEATRTEKGIIAEITDPFLTKNATKAPYPFGFTPTFYRYRLTEPAQKTKSQTIFVCSMADLFGDWVPDEWIRDVFDACKAAPQHRYLFLTKNPERYKQLLQKEALPAKENFWYGTTLTGTDGEVLRMSGKNCFLSIEPILAPFKAIDMWKHFGWVIIGAETGNRKDKVVPRREWIEDIVFACRLYNVPVFMKESLREIMGDDYIQEYPWN